MKPRDLRQASNSIDFGGSAANCRRLFETREQGRVRGLGFCGCVVSADVSITLRTRSAASSFSCGQPKCATLLPFTVVRFCHRVSGMNSAVKTPAGKTKA